MFNHLGRVFFFCLSKHDSQVHIYTRMVQYSLPVQNAVQDAYCQRSISCHVLQGLMSLVSIESGA